MSPCGRKHATSPNVEERPANRDQKLIGRAAEPQKSHLKHGVAGASPSRTCPPEQLYGRKPLTLRGDTSDIALEMGVMTELIRKKVEKSV